MELDIELVISGCKHSSTTTNLTNDLARASQHTCNFDLQYARDRNRRRLDYDRSGAQPEPVKLHSRAHRIGAAEDSLHKQHPEARPELRLVVLLDTLLLVESRGFETLSKAGVTLSERIGTCILQVET